LCAVGGLLFQKADCEVCAKLGKAAIGSVLEVGVEARVVKEGPLFCPVIPEMGEVVGT
jgi:hypothetical protein